MPNYPTIKTQAVTDTYFDIKVEDQFRSLEDENSPSTKQWISEQNQLTKDYMEAIPERQNIEKRLNQIWNFEKFSAPIIINDKTYFWKNDGLQNHSILYQESENGKEDKLILDPNTLSEKGTTSVSKISFSKSGKYLAYSISENGSDKRKIRILDMENHSTLEGELIDVIFTEIAWFKDGFFYTKMMDSKETTQMYKLCYHAIGSSQDKDVVLDIQNKGQFISAETTEDEKFLIIYTSQSTSGNCLTVVQLAKDVSNLENKDFIDIVTTFQNEFRLIGNKGSIVYFLTDYQAPNSQVVAIDFEQLKLQDTTEHWKTIIAEQKETLQEVILVSDKFACHYIQDAHSKLKVFGDKLEEVEMPGIGKVSDLRGQKSNKAAFFVYETFTAPTSVYKLNLNSNNSVSTYKAPKIDFDSSNFVTEQIFYSSIDGTKVPMFIVHKKDMVMDGKNPTWLYGYGGFNISVLPGFSASIAYFLERGGIFCVANIRGGGEYGKAWHIAGCKLNKQNVFDDFIAAAEYLIENKYTNSNKLAIEGASNGGLLVGACLTQRPELFKVCLPAVGVLDMMRYHKFTIGWAWADDYGTSAESKEMFEYLLKYSPVHNCKANNYPAVLITTADHDDRVVPAHSFKFAASLQKNQQGENPILIRIDIKAGHGSGKSTSMKIKEKSDILAFTLHNLGCL